MLSFGSKWQDFLQECYSRWHQFKLCVSKQLDTLAGLTEIKCSRTNITIQIINGVLEVMGGELLWSQRQTSRTLDPVHFVKHHNVTIHGYIS